MLSSPFNSDRRSISIHLRRAATVALLALWSASVTGGPRVSQSSRDRATTAPADPPLPVQASICFPGAAAARVKTFRGDGTVLWTDAPLDGKAVVARLRAVEEYLREKLPTSRPSATSLPVGPGATRPVAVAIYARAADYRALWRRVGAHYRGRFGPITTEGYSYRVFCATSYDSAERFQPRRSVICHEFAHVWLYQHHGLRNDGNWLTEGIATAVQMHFFPRAGSRGDFARWMHAGKMLPLKRLMDQPRIAPKDYWQAGTLAELLMLRDAGSLPAVVTAVNRRASAYEIVTQALKTDFSTLQKQWADSIRAAAGARPRPTTTSAASATAPEKKNAR